MARSSSSGKRKRTSGGCGQANKHVIGHVRHMKHGTSRGWERGTVKRVHACHRSSSTSPSSRSLIKLHEAVYNLYCFQSNSEYPHHPLPHQMGKHSTSAPRCTCASEHRPSRIAQFDRQRSPDLLATWVPRDVLFFIQHSRIA